jgi:hypothetical protein
MDIDEIFFIIIGCFKRWDFDSFVDGGWFNELMLFDGGWFNELMLFDGIVYVRFGKYLSMFSYISMLAILLLILD